MRPHLPVHVLRGGPLQGLDKAGTALGKTIAGLEVRAILREDGIKFLLPDDAWLLMRASGTEPLVRVYAEARSAGVFDDLLAVGRDMAAAASVPSPEVG